MLTTVHYIGIAILVGGLALLLGWPFLKRQLEVLKSAQRERDDWNSRRPIPTLEPVQPAPTPKREMSAGEIAYIESQAAFAKLKDLEAYFTKVGSADGLEAICKAGECMFRPPVVARLDTKPADQNVTPVT